MSRPEIGKVIEPSVPSDICDAAVEDACTAVQEAGTIPRILSYNMDDYTRYGSTLDNIAWKYGIVGLIDTTYLDGEWAVHNLKDGDERVTYWNTPP